jgi:hypothetical protein
MATFKIPEKTVAVIKNFSQLNPSIVISSDKVEVISTNKSAIGRYIFEEPLPFEEQIGLFDTPEFLSILGIYKSPDVTTSEKYLTVSEGTSKVRYFTTAANLLPKVLIQNKFDASDIKKRLDTVGCELEFVLPAEKLNMFLKMSQLLRAEWIFFESVDDTIRITVGDELESSNNTWELLITTDIKANTLTTPIKLNVSDLRLVPSDYDVKISTKGMSGWTSASGIEYYIGIFVV